MREKGLLARDSLWLVNAVSFEGDTTRSNTPGIDNRHSGRGVVVSSRQGIHIVAAAKKQQSKTRIVRGIFLADIVRDTQSQPPVYHWLVQSKGSPEVIGLGQEASFEEAEAAATSFLQSLASSKRKNR